MTLGRSNSHFGIIHKNLKQMITLKESFGTSIALDFFFSKIGAHSGDVLKKRTFAKKDKDIYKKLRPLMKEVKKPTQKIIPESPNTVWFFWWQGIENAPKLVRENLERAKKIFFDRRVVLITKDNFEDFVDIPMSIKAKVEEEVITLAAFSDILRFALLGKYGGLWMDSTIFLVRYPRILKKDLNVITLKGIPDQRPDFFYMNPSHYRWSIYFLGVFNDTAYAYFIFQCFLKYWEKYNTLIDYFLVDYFFSLSLDMFDDWNKQIELIPQNNLLREALNLQMNFAYDYSTFKEPLANTDLIKFSLRDEPKKTKIDGKLTLYGFLRRNGGL
ncbi:capsular polysaccharide synthesis protein [Lacticaseibacillus rhamnosus]|uniref:capsular polysaccharide synthesis protein n=1 Tax=Lacticaseibacillus rhamnosus TaxID=47715 RepID=UPI0011B1E445|nr:capsular polysaccharide synthesis protein [Lacticaseibacillus rhamnosus]